MGPKPTKLPQSQELIMLNFSTQLNVLRYVGDIVWFFYILEQKEMMSWS